MNQLLDITKVDFTNASDIEGYASLLFAAANNIGMLTSDAPPSIEATELRQAAKAWIGKVDDNISTLSAGDILNVIGCYDVTHRLAYRYPANAEYLNRHKLNVFEARTHGDDTINEYHLFRAISLETQRGNRDFYGRPLQWLTLSINQWHKQFQYGVSIERASDYETIMRVSCLLDSNLWAHESDDDKFKRNLFSLHRHHLDNPDDKDFGTLMALDSFLASSARYLTPQEFTDCESALRHAILTHPATNRYLRASMAI